MYEIVRALHLVNHAWALILPYVALNLLFAIWFSQWILPADSKRARGSSHAGWTRPIPDIFQDHASIGHGRSSQCGVLVFIFSWNEFMFALTFMNVEASKTITVGLATLSGAFSVAIPWGLLAAEVVASSLPLILLVAIFQKQIVAGLTAGSLK